MKKLLTAILALLLALSFTACGLISPDEREIVTRHYDSTDSTEQRRIYKVSNYDSLVSTLYNVLTERVETCVLRFFGYDTVFYTRCIEKYILCLLLFLCFGFLPHIVFYVGFQTFKADVKCLRHF